MRNAFQNDREKRKDLVMVLLYVILTYAGTWIIWFFIPAIELLGSCMPSIVGFILLFVRKETAGVGRRMIDFADIRLSWYPVIFLTVPVTTAFAYCTYSILGGEISPVGFSGYLKNPAGLLVIAVLSLGAGLGEELGWRGILQDRLQRRWNPLMSSILVGVIWASWHIPLPLLSGESLISPRFLNYFFFIVVLAVLIGRIYNGTGRSILAAILFHFAANATLFTLFPKNDMPVGMDIVRTIYLLVVVVLILFAGKKKAGSVTSSEEFAN